MNWSGASYLQNQSGLSELARQEREAAIKKKREDSLGYQIGHGVTGALKGAAGGALKGAVIGSILAPGVGTIAGATLGAGSGALSGGGVLSGAEQKSIASNLAQAAISKNIGKTSYLNQSPTTSNGASYSDSMGLAGMTPEEYDQYMQSQLSGPGYMR